MIEAEVSRGLVRQCRQGAADRAVPLQRGDDRVGADGDDAQLGVHIAEVVDAAPAVEVFLLRNGIVGAGLLGGGTGEPIDRVEGELRLIDVDGPD